MGLLKSVALSIAVACITSAVWAAPTPPAPERTPGHGPEKIEVYDQFSSDEDAYEHFLEHFKPDWEPESEQDLLDHFRTFTANLALIRAMDAEIKSEGGRLEVGVTRFTDMKNRDFQERVLMQNRRGQQASEQTWPVASLAALHDLPANLDWREKGVVGPVKNQWSCGSCYIFSAVGTIESNFAISHNTSRISLSEQQVLDCNGNYGCDGGWPVQVYQYAEQDGLCPHDDYHYWDFKKKCDRDTVKYCQPKVFVSDYKQLPAKDDQALLEALQEHTVSITMDASSLFFQFYIGGIFESKHCPKSPELNHALEVVGYGVDSHGHKYWEVKNSWGELWGFGGYIKVDRNTPNTCGISETAAYPVVAK